MIVTISWKDIESIWREKLWQARQSPIEPNSAMNFLGGYSNFNMTTEPIFLGYYFYDKLVGVNSGHMCENKEYRSRGLYVDPEHRGQGIGVQLLDATINQARNENAKMIWSLPRFTSWKTYQKAGFILHGDWFRTETSDSNAYCWQWISENSYK